MYLKDVFKIGENEYLAKYGQNEEEVNATAFFSIPANLLAKTEQTFITSGFNTEGEPFQNVPVNVSYTLDDVSDLIGEQRKVNPTKVMWAIYYAAKAVLCPNCNPGYK